MEKRNITQLAIYSIEEDVETLPVERLQKLYLEKTSEIVYIIRDNKLYGCVSMGEVLRGKHKNAEVRINRSFTFLTGFNVIKAHEIFQKYSYIHKIPVVGKHGELLGDYSRWDDMLYFERNQKLFMCESVLKEILGKYEAVYVVAPVEYKHPAYLCLKEYLEKFQIRYEVLTKEQVGEKISEKVICIFLSEDERRGIECLYGIVPYRQTSIESVQIIDILRYDMPTDVRYKARLATYKSLLFQIEREMQLKRLKIRKPDDLFYDRLDEKASVLLPALEKKGIKCFPLFAYEEEATEYRINFQRELMERQKMMPLTTGRLWMEDAPKKAFYGDLYQLDDYKTGKVEKEVCEGDLSFEYKGNILGKYFNARDGKRVTCFQPEKYIGTIYLLGPCTIVGGYVEDQYTIASYLQKELLERGYIYRVENYGQIILLNSIDSRLKEIDKYSANDIVIYLSREGETLGISKQETLEKIYEKNHVSYEWVTDGYLHCNHKVNQLIAESMFDMIKTCLADEVTVNCDRNINIDVPRIMREYIQCKYLDQYFGDFSGEEYSTVGAIVMNGNPFSRGHRYLIEQAGRQVEFLIVFVVEEDASLFPFEERYRLIKEGTKDIDNIMVVPSGEFILSKNNFEEYFTKQENEAVAFHAEYDINIFADYIAGSLHITHRFAGEEPEDQITSIYNDAMRRILPSKGITFVEIPRITVKDEFVSASRVRKYLLEEKNDKAFDLLPVSTTSYLMSQM